MNELLDFGAGVIVGSVMTAALAFLFQEFRYRKSLNIGGEVFTEDRKTVSPPINTKRRNPFLPPKPVGVDESRFGKARGFEE